ncbi:MAG: hypothetical protein M0037_07550 [Betaproteobacteria bacterium]|nr:hypothetical protein [Betaproteobacteria bacterium]
MAINAVQILHLTAGAEIPAKILIFRFWLGALKNSAICPRSLQIAAQAA